MDITSATVTAFYLFEVAEQIDLTRLRTLIRGGEEARLTSKSTAPSYMQYQTPPVVADGDMKAASGELPLEHLSEMSDEEVIEAITKVKGLGRWSAEMFLMFRLRRPDVLPVDDLGIVNAIHRLYKLRKRPDAKRILKLGEAWRPYRTVACWYLWRSLENTPLDSPKPAGLRQQRTK